MDEEKSYLEKFKEMSTEAREALTDEDWKILSVCLYPKCANVRFQAVLSKQKTFIDYKFWCEATRSFIPETNKGFPVVLECDLCKPAGSGSGKRKDK